MKISCFEPETKVTISVSSDENKIALESEVVGITDQGDAKKLLELCKAYKCPNFVVIKGIMSNGKMLNFDGYQLRSKVTSIYKDRPYCFSSLRICNTTLSVGDVHVIFRVRMLNHSIVDVNFVYGLAPMVLPYWRK